LGVVFAQSGVAKLADRRRIDLAITPACSAGGLQILKLRPRTYLASKAGAIQQSAYPSSPGKWHVHLALENSRINTGNTGIFFRVKAESHYQGFTQPPTQW